MPDIVSHHVYKMCNSIIFCAPHAMSMAQLQRHRSGCGACNASNCPSRLNQAHHAAGELTFGQLSMSISWTHRRTTPALPTAALPFASPSIGSWPRPSSAATGREHHSTAHARHGSVSILGIHSWSPHLRGEAVLRLWYPIQIALRHRVARA